MAKTYSQLSEASRKKLDSHLRRIYKNGYSVKEVLAMSDLELRQKFSLKVSAIEGFKKNTQQLQFTQERKEKISDRSLNEFVKQQYRGKGLSRVKSRLRKTIGLNIFFDISKKVQSQYNLTKNQSYRRTDLILRRARTNYRGLSKREREILSFFS